MGLVDGGGMPVEVVFFNVGQGDCTLLWFYDRAAPGIGTHAILVDCGTAGAVPPWRPAAVVTGDAKQRVIAHLRGRLDHYLSRLRDPYTLDWLVVTHPDQDHFNLLQDVLVDGRDPARLKYTIRNVAYSLRPADYREGGGDFMARLFTEWTTFTGVSGQRVVNEPQLVTMPPDPVPLLGTGPGADLHLVGGVVGPTIHSRGAQQRPGDVKKFAAGEKERIANMCSLVTVLTGEPDAFGKRQKVLLMADAESINEQYLMGLAGPMCSRESHLWLKLGHHGSKHSTSDEWLAHTTPDGLFISTGLNAFGGGVATCDAENLAGRVLVQWERIRTAHGIPVPTVRAGLSWGFGFQDNTDAPPWPFVYAPTTDGVFSSLALEPDTAGWRGVDWHLRLDHAAPGSYDIWYE
ncbi:ComEC/Rec2 family competence protein [Kitasatospora acidiphila]|uniref:ComEC/Rec2 family competence protein n=1 Tax=Kitasatospora acidiphila TaxID=2567942 RepID=UPI003C759E42